MNKHVTPIPSLHTWIKLHRNRNRAIYKIKIVLPFKSSSHGSSHHMLISVIEKRRNWNRRNIIWKMHIVYIFRLLRSILNWSNNVSTTVNSENNTTNHRERRKGKSGARTELKKNSDTIMKIFTIMMKNRGKCGTGYWFINTFVTICLYIKASTITNFNQLIASIN